MNSHRFTYSSQKAEIIRSVLAGSPIKEVAAKYNLTTSRVHSIVLQTARRWQKHNNLTFDLNLTTIRTYSNEINNFVSSYSPETPEEKNVRVTKRNLKNLQFKLLTLQNQIKQMQDSIKEKQNTAIVMNNLIEEAENELKEAIEIAKQSKGS